MVHRRPSQVPRAPHVVHGERINERGNVLLGLTCTVQQKGLISAPIHLNQVVRSQVRYLSQFSLFSKTTLGCICCCNCLLDNIFIA